MKRGNVIECIKFDYACVNCKLTPRKYAGEIYAAEIIKASISYFHTYSNYGLWTLLYKPGSLFLSVYSMMFNLGVWSCDQEMFLLTNAK